MNVVLLHKGDGDVMEKMEIFLYCAPEDEPVLQALLKQLQVFEHRGMITLWHNHAFPPGADVKREVARYIAEAVLILLLVSPDFMNATYAFGPQVAEAMKRHRQGKASVIPVILSPVSWQGAPFGDLQALPRGGMPVTAKQWRGQVNALYSVAQSLEQVLLERGTADVAALQSESEVTIQDLLPTGRTPVLAVDSLLAHWGALGILISVTLGLEIIALLQNDSTRLWSFLQRYPWLGGSVLLLTAGVPLWFWWQRKRPSLSHDEQGPGARQRRRRQNLRRRTFSLVVPATSTTLFLGLLLLVLVRPTWCPTQICAASVLAGSPGEARDTNLSLSFVAQQSVFFDLPGNPGTYTVHNLPSTKQPGTIVAVNSDVANSDRLQYVLALRVTNLHMTGYSISIEQVNMNILDVPALSNPLYVWQTNSLAYRSELYAITYYGEGAGSVLPARYRTDQGLRGPGVHQQLNPGEPDALDLQIAPEPHLRADVRFHVSVVYRMANEAQEYTLTLAQIFEVVFSNNSNWHVQTF
ncbi:MAG TPA: toll/interleukin-1 receptor domain-containing protein [Ktedonobacteraceae bacterium]